MPELLQALSDWPYVAWAFAAASVFYLVTSFAVAHLNPDRRASLSLYLQGDYRETWVSDFCALFDSVFGTRHWGLRCFALSAIASVVAVLALWVLLGPILGLVDLRSETALTLTQVLLIGAAINILPDYLSLYETRWLLKQFARVRNPLGQITVLALDAAVTGAIIYLGVTVFLFLQGEELVSVVEVAALFSIYTVFFWSTFLTSVWAWGYCISSWLAAISARLASWLDLRDKPGASLALIGAVAVFVVALGLKPLLTMDDRGRIALDDVLCDTFPAQICPHLSRISDNTSEKLALLEKACLAGAAFECFARGSVLYEEEEYEAANRYFEKACDEGVAAGCFNLGIAFEQGLGFEVSAPSAASYYDKACAKGDAQGCFSIGNMYELGNGVEKSARKSLIKLGKSCILGEPVGCYIYIDKARFTAEFRDRRFLLRIYLESYCELGDGMSCYLAGVAYQNGLLILKRPNEANPLYIKSCELGEAWGCTQLGLNYRDGIGLDLDIREAVLFLQRGCNGEIGIGCHGLAALYESGDGVPRDPARARELFAQACDLGHAPSCEALTTSD